MRDGARKIEAAAPDLRQRKTAPSSDTPPSKERKVGKKGAVKEKIKLISIRLGLDMPLVFFTLALVLIGLIMMFSASYVFAYATKNGDSYYYLERQAIFAAIGVIIMIGFSFFDYRKLLTMRIPILKLRISTLFLLISIALLAIVLLAGKDSEGVSRWIRIGSFSFQPSEIAKFSLILFMADYASRNMEKMGTFKKGILPNLLVVGLFCVLLVLEPHYSCTIIIIMLAAIMMFLGGVKLRYFLLLAGFLVIALIIVNFTVGFNYFMDRIGGWGQSLEYINESQWQSTWQTRNSLYAIGSGGLWGLGLGQSRQKYLYLPEPQNDFVFSIVCEELGLIGATIIILLFAVLVWRGITVSMRAKDIFGRILGTGIMAQIGLQVILNILVITDSLPNTGISLPFFSYGGSSLLMLLAQMSIVLSISRNSRSEKV